MWRAATVGATTIVARPTIELQEEGSQCSTHIVCYTVSLTSGSTVGFDPSLRSDFNSAKKSLNLGLHAVGICRNILSCATVATERDWMHLGMSSNGRTADSGSVNGGSTPSIPASASYIWPVRLAVRTPPSQGGDHRFESGTGYHRLFRAPSGAFFILLAVVVAIL